MIRNIIFDIGNVLTDFRWQGFLRDKGFDDAMIRRIADATIKSPLWVEFDRGVWSDEDLMRRFVENDPEIEREMHIAYDDIHGMVVLRDYAIPWVQNLKAEGYGVYYLSNFSRKAEEECGDSLAFLPYMDGGILSWKDKLIKPDPRIYRLLLDRYGLDPRECFFIDDTKMNVEAAVAEGIHGIVFESKEQVERELRRLEADGCSKSAD
ncbi:MAG: HAD family phosphatase [Clostridium sp.]|nr:HAD family phosphatase [Acetatifactor muris]MCM1527069.1 HAD family phosphatase [Bacteroides sp.]MCM1562045.1 HAD family phosphatase [Clostridium sp.]